MSSQSRSVAVIIANCIGVAMNRVGGETPASILWFVHVGCGSILIRYRNGPRPSLRPTSHQAPCPPWTKRTQFFRSSRMSSFRQIAANRRNALKSTGPRTSEGKQHSRCNAVRHGLTAETVIGALEDVADYRSFEAAITADYDAQSTIERELVLRLASLLWRLRRATTIETGLFEIQADQVREHKKNRRWVPLPGKLCTNFLSSAPRVSRQEQATRKRSMRRDPQAKQSPTGLSTSRVAFYG
jgi:hypothetical protein